MPAVCLWARGGRDGAPETAVAMIDDFALGLTMFLILTALWRIAHRRDLDSDTPPELHAANDPGPIAHPLGVPSLFGDPHAPRPTTPTGEPLA